MSQRFDSNVNEPTTENTANQGNSVDEIDDRSATAKGIDIATRITSMSISTVLPALGGYYLDLHWNCSPAFLVVGMVFGLASGFWMLLKLVSHTESSKQSRKAMIHRLLESAQKATVVGLLIRLAMLTMVETLVLIALIVASQSSGSLGEPSDCWLSF